MSDMVYFNGVRCTFEEWARLESEYKAKIDIQARKEIINLIDKDYATGGSKKAS